jgi:hypothetical protein
MQRLNLGGAESSTSFPWETGFRRSRRLGAWLGKLAERQPDLVPRLVPPPPLTSSTCIEHLSRKISKGSPIETQLGELRDPVQKSGDTHIHLVLLQPGSPIETQLGELRDPVQKSGDTNIHLVLLSAQQTSIL